MNEWLKILRQHKQVNWFFIVALLVMSLIPIHIHFEHPHEFNSSGHEHHTTLHSSIDSDIDHHIDEGSVALDISPDTILKLNDSGTLIIAFLVLGFIFLAPRCNKTTWFIRPFSDSNSRHHYLTPLLRAPPR